MRRIVAIRVVEAPGVEVEQVWYDRSRWASWIDDFGHLSKLTDDWPRAGARRIWATKPGGRGLISETVSAYGAGDGQTLDFEEESIAGVQQVRFETDGVRTRITVRVELETKVRMPPGRRWWLRRQHRAALERSLARFSYEVDAERTSRNAPLG